MYQSEYYIDKSSGTPGDTEAAYGLASILRSVLESAGELNGTDVKLIDEGDKYSVQLPVTLTSEMIESCQFFAPIEFILTAKNGTKKPVLTGVLDYEGEKARNAEYYERRKNLPPEARGKNADPFHPALQGLVPPKSTWPLFQAINQMAAIIGYNDSVVRWEDNNAQFAAVLKLILQMTATSPNRIEETEIAWNVGVKQSQFKGKTDATASQLFNPASGKGQNSSKSSALAMGNLNSFWLLEFLKCVGGFESAAPRIISNPKNPRAKDRKLYVLAPKDITFATNKAIWDDFQQAFRSDTSVKMDIRAALTYTRIFLERSETGAQAGLTFDFDNNGPENYVHGLWAVFYKDLGNSSAVMNISFIGLPNWIKKVDTPEVAKLYEAIIEEHEGLLRNLKEERSEDYDILLTYRNFLSGRDLTALLDFYADYGRLYMGVTEREWDSRGRYMLLPSIDNLEVIMTNHEPKLGEIVKNPGFLQVAYALRHSTVIPQRSKARGLDRLYEPKYGLIQDLKRKGQYKDEFIAALTDFVSSYNLETEQVFERKKGFSNPEDIGLRKFQRSRVERQHLDSVVELVEANGSTLICNMLAAYGSAVDTKSKQEREAARVDAGSQAEDDGQAEDKE